MKKHTKPAIDKSIDRESISVDDFSAAMRSIVRSEASELKSENREPTKGEIEQQYKLIQRK